MPIILHDITNMHTKYTNVYFGFSETQNQQDDETKKGLNELAACITRVRHKLQGQDETSIYQAINKECLVKREIAFDNFM